VISGLSPRRPIRAFRPPPKSEKGPFGWYASRVQKKCNNDLKQQSEQGHSSERIGLNSSFKPRTSCTLEQHGDASMSLTGVDSTTKRVTEMRDDSPQRVAKPGDARPGPIMEDPAELP
jgi:hypothetical protein